VRGVVRRGARVFRGLRYASPPVGEGRWAHPADPRALGAGGVPLAGCHSGTLDASRFGPVCPQPGDGGPVAADETQSEDCLFLNVYAPAAPEAAPAAGEAPLLPVVVFLHGGGNVRGAGSRYDMSAVAARGFVAVTLNHRLGALGFLASDALAGAREGANLGLRDIAAALAWVRRNARGFGGDATRVTLAGHGSGGTNALALTTSPIAVLDGAPLFARVLSMSPPPRFGQLRREAAKADAVFSADAGCAGRGDGESACLRALSVSEVLAASPLRVAPWWDGAAAGPADERELPTTGGRRAGLLVVDGDVLTAESWIAMGQSDRPARVPLMLTAMAAEPDARPARGARVHTAADYAAAVRARLGPLGSFWSAAAGDVALADAALAAYPAGKYSSPQEALDAMVTDVRLTCGLKRLAGMAAASAPEPVFLGVNFMKLSEPVAVLGASSDGVAPATATNLARAAAPGHASSLAFHGLAVGGGPPPPPPLPRTNRTSLVPPLVLSGHAASLRSSYGWATPRGCAWPRQTRPRRAPCRRPSTSSHAPARPRVPASLAHRRRTRSHGSP